MNKYRMTEDEYPAINQVYPEYSKEELAEAEETISRYVHLVWRIHERLVREGKKFDGRGFKR